MSQIVTYAAVEKGMEHKGEQRCYLYVLPNISIFSNTLLTKLSSQLFYSLSSMLLFDENSHKVPGLLFVFICISKGHTYFQNNEINFLSTYKTYCSVI